MNTKNFTLITLLFVSLSCFCSCVFGSSASEEIATDFLKKMFTCEFEAAKAHCTEQGAKQMLWFSSNLTEEDLALITEVPEVVVTGIESDERRARLSCHVTNVIVCDSLEKPGHIGERDIELSLLKQGDSWLVDDLEW